MAGPLTTLSLEQVRARRDEILALAAQHSAANIRVIGSVARGDADTSSDVDFLVDLDSSHRLRGFAYFGALDALHRELEATLGCTVDVIDAASLAARSGEMPSRALFRERVLRDAVPL